MRQTRLTLRKTERRRESFSNSPPCGEADAAYSSNVLCDTSVVAVPYCFDRDGFEFGKLDVAVVAVFNKGNLRGDGVVQVFHPDLPTRKVGMSGIALSGGYGF